MRVKLPHTAIYWAPGAPDKLGQPTYNAPVQVKCRWDDGAIEAINSKSEVVYATSTVILQNNDVEPGGLLMLGELPLPSGFPNSPVDADTHEVVSRKKTDDLKGGNFIVQAFLV